MDAVDRANEIMEQDLQNQLAAHRQMHAETANECDSCGDLISSARQIAVPGCRHCLTCQEAFEHRRRVSGVA